MSTALGFRREVVPRPIFTTPNHARTPQHPEAAGCSGPPPLRGTRVWARARLAVWAVACALGVVAYFAPSRTLEAVSTLTVHTNATDPVVCSGVLDEDAAALLVRGAAVFVLLAASAAPCEWEAASRFASCLSLLVAVTFWSVLLTNDGAVKMEAWFGVSVLILGIALPLASVATDVLQRAWTACPSR